MTIQKEPKEIQTCPFSSQRCLFLHEKFREKSNNKDLPIKREVTFVKTILRIFPLISFREICPGFGDVGVPVGELLEA